jgi:hypothetical protein
VIPTSNDTALRVTRGLDPRVHHLRKKMDCRVRPGNDTAEFLMQQDQSRWFMCTRPVEASLTAGKIIFSLR